MGATSEMYIAMQDEIINTVHRAENGDISHLDAVIDLRKKREELETGLSIIKEYESTFLTDIQQEASEYKEGYRGYQFEFRNGRKTYSFKNLPEHTRLSKQLKDFESKAKSAFELYQKTGEKPITESGEELPLPEINYGKSYMIVKEKR